MNTDRAYKLREMGYDTILGAANKARSRAAALVKAGNADPARKAALLDKAKKYSAQGNRLQKGGMKRMEGVARDIKTRNHYLGGAKESIEAAYSNLMERKGPWSSQNRTKPRVRRHKGSAPYTSKERKFRYNSFVGAIKTGTLSGFAAGLGASKSVVGAAVGAMAGAAVGGLHKAVQLVRHRGPFTRSNKGR